MYHHIWNMGVSVGEVALFFQFRDICLVQQMLSGVHSERGISAGSTVVSSVGSDGSVDRRTTQRVFFDAVHRSCRLL